MINSADNKLMMKVLVPRIMAKALSALDKSTAIVVGVCWLVALITLITALLSVHAAVSAKRDAADAIVAEPVLPEAVTTKINIQEGQVLIDRMQHQFPEIKFDLDGSQAIVVKADDGAKFHQWITALGYLDAVAPQYRWTLRSFCVGRCAGSDLMRAEVTGQKVLFNLPARPE